MACVKKKESCRALFKSLNKLTTCQWIHIVITALGYAEYEEISKTFGYIADILEINKTCMWQIPT